MILMGEEGQQFPTLRDRYQRMVPSPMAPTRTLPLVFTARAQLRGMLQIILPLRSYGARD